jgi:hypothetical protein
MCCKHGARLGARQESVVSALRPPQLGGLQAGNAFPPLARSLLKGLSFSQIPSFCEVLPDPHKSELGPPSSHLIFSHLSILVFPLLCFYVILVHLAINLLALALEPLEDQELTHIYKFWRPQPNAQNINTCCAEGVHYSVTYVTLSHLGGTRAIKVLCFPSPIT